MNPKISVIIPTYNAEDYLEEAVNSVINQSFGFENIELILVDDNSTDSTKEILIGLRENYTNVKVILSEDNSGTASKPRNLGIESASCDYVMFLDNDDLYYPEMCEKMYEIIVSENVDVVCCRYKINSFSSSKIPNSFLDSYEYFIKFDSINDFPEIMTLGFPTMIWTKLFRKKTILDNDIKFPEGDLYEDVYFSAKFYLNAKGIIILNNFYGYNYQVRTEGENKSTCQIFTKSMLIKQLNGFLKLMELLNNEKLERYKNYEILKAELIIDMTKIYIYTDLDKNCQLKFLRLMKPFYKQYKLNRRVHTTNLIFNLIINIFIKIFSVSNKIPIFLSNFYTYVK